MKLTDILVIAGGAIIGSGLPLLIGFIYSQTIEFFDRRKERKNKHTVDQQPSYPFTLEDFQLLRDRFDQIDQELSEIQQAQQKPIPCADSDILAEINKLNNQLDVAQFRKTEMVEWQRETLVPIQNLVLNLTDLVKNTEENLKLKDELIEQLKLENQQLNRRLELSGKTGEK